MTIIELNNIIEDTTITADYEYLFYNGDGNTNLGSLEDPFRISNKYHLNNIRYFS